MYKLQNYLQIISVFNLLIVILLENVHYIPNLRNIYTKELYDFKIIKILEIISSITF
jgi:hypothetical protein